MEKKVTTAQRGNAGEHYANWLLQENGFRVYVADRNNPAHDMVADYHGRACFIRVKTTTTGTPRWTAKKDGKVFKNVYRGIDFILIVDLSQPRKGGFNFYVVPTERVEKTLRQLHLYFIRFRTRKGARRKNSAIRGLVFRGFDTKKNIGRGFDWKWHDYRNCFDAIVRPHKIRIRKPKGVVFKVWALCGRYKDKLLNGRMSRQQFLERCMKRGINRSTAAVQYAHWKKTQTA